MVVYITCLGGIMKYIEKNENETNEYEVLIKGEELSNIIKELNEKCCRAIKVNVNVTAYQESEALEKINKIRKNEVSIISKKELPEYNKGSLKTDKTLYLYECEYFRKQISYLSYLLAASLSSYHSNNDMSYVINQLIEYENNDEIKTYQERMAEQGIIEELFMEYENNKDFDFALLRELYQKAKECFKLVLVSKTIHYDNEENTKTLGR